MSVFTDDNLKQLKESMVLSTTVVDSQDLAALIDRLEAAEKLAEWVMTWESHENCNQNGCECGLQKDIKAWLKSSGKEGQRK